MSIIFVGPNNLFLGSCVQFYWKIFLFIEDLPRVFRVVDAFGGAVFGSIIFIVWGRPFLFVRIDVEISSCVVFTEVDNVSVILQKKIYFNTFRQFLSRTLFLLIQNENEMKHFFVVELDVWKFPPRQLLYLLLNFHDHNFQ
jgi:hypothetical protein